MQAAGVDGLPREEGINAENYHVKTKILYFSRKSAGLISVISGARWGT